MVGTDLLVDAEAVPTTTLANLLQPRPWCLVVLTNYKPLAGLHSHVAYGLLYTHTHTHNCVQLLLAESTTPTSAHYHRPQSHYCTSTRRHAVGSEGWGGYPDGVPSLPVPTVQYDMN